MTDTKRFNVGDIMWVADAGSTKRTRACRVCNGEKTVTLVLGSGEHVRLDCDFCSRGYESPSGIEQYYDYAAQPTPHRITGIEIVILNGQEIVTYREGSENAWQSFKAANCFATSDAALERCAELIVERAAEIERQFRCKTNGAKTYAWNAGYHLREAASARKQVAYHEQKAAIMRDMAKPYRPPNDQPPLASPIDNGESR